jgi:hypothetical protein
MRLHDYASPPVPRTSSSDPYRAYSSAADRVILDRQALAPVSAAACRTGSAFWRRNRSPVTVPRASGENPGQDDPDAAGVLDLDSGPEMGTSPGSSNGPEPGRRPCPGTPWRSRPPRPRPPGRRRIRLPGASILYLGITLSDERGEGERAHCRRYGRFSGDLMLAADRNRMVDLRAGQGPGLRRVPGLPRFVWHVSNRAESHC